MKKVQKRRFTLIELMFVVAILIILIGISWVAGRTVLRNQVKQKTKSEITLLMAAVAQYNDRFPGSYPWGADNVNQLAGLANSNTTTTVTTAYGSLPKITWGQMLSSALPGTGYTGKREMYVDYAKNNIFVSNSNYADANATATTVRDPYERDYCYYYDATKKVYVIWSAGLDGLSAFPFQNHGPVTTSGRALYNRLDDVASNDLSK